MAAAFRQGRKPYFDFPLRYKLKDVCDTPNYDLRKLTDGESVSAGRPFNAVTFTENHDMGGNEVVNDKMLGYSFILTGDGYPCIFWWDRTAIDASRAEINSHGYKHS